MGEPEAVDVEHRTEPAEDATPVQRTPDAKPPSGAAIGLGDAILQAKLTVGPVGDRYEREADEVADRVVRSLRNGGGGQEVEEPAAPRVQRASAIGAEGGALDADTDRAIRSSRGGGKAMPTTARRQMEGAFGADFSGIRVHEGSQAAALNERIQAKAFTVGNDVFFRDGMPDTNSSSGQHLLAHELTHTIQQGGAPAQRSTDAKAVPTDRLQRDTGTVVRRNVDTIITQTDAQLSESKERLPASKAAMLDPATFKEATKTKWHRRGAALKAIDKYLVEYKALAPPAGDVNPGVPNPGMEEFYKKKQKLLLMMQYAAEQWILDHAVNDEQGSRTLRGERGTAGGTFHKAAETHQGWMIDPKRKKRFAGMAFFRAAVKEGLEAMQRSMAAADKQTIAQLDGSDDARHTKLKEKYDSDPSSMLSKIGWLIDGAVPKAGDSSELEVAFRWPVDPTGTAFVGGTLRLSAEKDSVAGGGPGGRQAKDNVTTRAELVFTFGAQFLELAKFQAEIGGYMEASGKSGADCMTMLSYSLFRRCRESYVVPRAMTNYMWGGRKGKFGAIKAEKWSKDVEKTLFDDDDAYVETGLIAGVSAEGGYKANDTVSAEFGGGITFGIGSRYDKTSIESVKNQLGDSNEKRAPNNFTTTQKRLARRTIALGFGFEASVGPFSGSTELAFKWIAEQAKDGRGANNKIELDSAELSVDLKASVPSAGGDELGEKIAGWAMEGVKFIADKARAGVEARKDNMQQALTDKQAKQRKQRNSAKIRGEIWSSLFDGLDQLRNVDGIESAINPGASDSTWLAGRDNTGLGNIAGQHRDAMTEQFGEGGRASFGQAARSAESTSTIGLKISIGGDFVAKEFALSVSIDKDRELSIPLFLDISQSKSSRLFVLSKASGENWEIR